MLGHLKAGLAGHVKFQSAAGQVLVVQVSLKSISAALQALPCPAPAAPGTRYGANVSCGARLCETIFLATETKY